jgi:hypothetical protein
MTARILFATAIAALAASAQARTRLVALPERATLVVNLDHPEQSLVTEERELTLQKGLNQIDFSWQGVSISRDSLRIAPLDHPGDSDTSTKVLGAELRDSEAALTWNIFSPEARTERVRVTYLLGGVQRESSYEWLAAEDEKSGRLEQRIALTNSSGEDFENAVLRMSGSSDWQRTVDSGESRRFLASTTSGIPMQKRYIAALGWTHTSGDDGEPISLFYEFRNDAASKLGTRLLPYGKARIFSAGDAGDNVFLGEDWLKATAVGEKAELGIGTVKDVVLKRRVVDSRDDVKKKNRSGYAVLIDRVVTIRYEIENFKDMASVVRVKESIPRDAVLEESPSRSVTVTRKSSTEIEIEFALEPRPAGSAKIEPKEFVFRYRQPNVPTNGSIGP